MASKQSTSGHRARRRQETPNTRRSRPRCPIFQLEACERRLFFSADPTTQKILNAFEFVHNTIEYQPYAGLMKGPVATEQTRAGNAWDQASLLIQKLKAIDPNITADYRYAIVEAPTEEVERWLGVKDETAAETVLGTAGLVFPTGVNGSVRFWHTWVCANVPGLGYMDLDPSWKFKDLPDKARPLVDAIGSAVPFNDAARDVYLSEVRRELPYEYYEGLVQDQLRLQGADGVSLADVPYDGPIIAKRFTAIPTELAVKLIGGVAEVAAGTELLTTSTWNHRVRITLTGSEGQILRATISVPGSGRNTINIRYAEDPTLPAGQRRAQLLLGDTIEAAGNVTLGTQVTLTVDHLDPGETTADIGTVDADGNKVVNSFDFVRASGTPLAIGLGAQQFSEDSLMQLQAELNALASDANPNAETYQEKLLGMAAMKYFHDVSVQREGIAGLIQMLSIRPNVESGLMMGDENPRFPNIADAEEAKIWKLQNPIVSDKIATDNPNLGTQLMALEGNTILTSDASRNAYSLVTLNNSAIEHAFLEQLLNSEAISTVKGIQWAKTQAPASVPVHKVAGNDSAAFDALELSQKPEPIRLRAEMIAAIRADVSAGFDVQFPETMVFIGNWTGGVWIKEKVTATQTAIQTSRGHLIMKVGETAGHGGSVTERSRPAPLIQIAESNHGIGTGDPVNVLTGSMYHDEQDIAIPNIGIPLVFGRHYESMLDDGTNAAAYTDPQHPLHGALKNVGFGVGWTHTYSDYLTFTTSNNIEKATWHTSDGKHHEFTQVNDTSRYYYQPGGVYGEFKRDTELYTYTEKNGLKHIFFRNNNGDIARLVQIRDRNGNYLRVVHDANGLVQRVEDGNAPTRALVFTASASHPGHIGTIEDFTGRTWTYDYADHAGGAGKVLIEAKGPADEDQYHRTYGYYPSGKLKGLLETITNEATEGLHRFHYYPNRRAFSNAAFGALNDVTGVRKFLQQEYFSYDVLHNETTGYDNLATRYIDHLGRVTTYIFDKGQNHQTKRVIHPDRTREDNVWDNFLLKKTADDLGREQNFTHDAQGNVITQTQKLNDTESLTTTYVYDPTFNGVTSMTQAAPGQANRVTNSTYDANGNVLSTTDAEGNTTSWTYLATGNRGLPETMTSPRGNVAGATGNFTTSYTYNPAGQVLTTQTDDPGTPDLPNDRLTTVTDYDDQGNLVQVTDASGHVTQYGYDAYNRQTTMTTYPDGDGPLPGLVTRRHYKDGKLHKVISPRGTASGADLTDFITEYQYDTLGRLVLTRYPMNAEYPALTTSSAWYDPAGNMLGSTDELGRTTHFFYDRHNRLVQTLYADGGFELARYDGAGRVISVATPLNDVTPYGLDPVARTAHAYDLGDRNVYTWDAVNQVTTRTYNGFGDMTQELFFSNIASHLANAPHRTTRYVLDDLGRVIERRGDDRIVTVTRFDPNGNVDVATRYDVTGLDALTVGLTNLPRRETVIVFDVLDRPIAVTDPMGQQSSTTYYKNGQVKGTTDANGNTTTRFYDAAGRLVHELLPDPDGAGSQVAPGTEYAYDENGNLTTLTNARNLVTTYGYDARDRQVKVMDANGGEIHTQYHPTGEIEWQEQYLPGSGALPETSPGRRKTEYKYDLRGRLVHTILPDPDKADTKLPPENFALYNAAGHLVETIDEVGTITRFEYDAAGRVIKTAAGAMKIARVARLGDIVTVNTVSPHTFATGDQVEVSGTSHAGYDGRFTVTRINAYAFSYLAPSSAPVRDLFDSADGSPLGSTDTDQPWVVNLATWEIQGGAAVAPAGNAHIATVGAGFSDGIVEAKVAVGSYNWGLIARATTGENYLLVRLNTPDASGNMSIHLMRARHDAAANEYAIIGSAGAIVKNGDTIALGAEGDQITVYHNGTVVITASEAFNQTATKWGMRHHNPNGEARFDDFSVTEVLTGQAVGEALASSVVESFEYLNNDLSAETDERGYRTTHTYDKAGRLLQTAVDPDPEGTPDTAPAEVAETFGYNAYGDLTGHTTFPAPGTSHTTTFTYDALGRKVTEDAPAAAGAASARAVTHGYDAVGNLTWEMDALGGAKLAEMVNPLVPASITFTLGGSAADHGVYTIQRTGTRSWGSPYYQGTTPGGTTIEIELYDTSWSMWLDDGSTYYTEGDHDGTTFNDWYGVDWLVAISGTVQTQAQGIEQMRLANFHTQTFKYDGLNRLTEAWQADPDRASLTDGGIANNVPVTSYLSYDGDGNLLVRKDPAGNDTTYTYDNLDRVATETTNAFLNAAQPNVAVTRSYTYADANFAATGQLFDQTTDRNGRVRKVFYDGLDRAVKETWGDGGGGVTREMNFTYDDAGRLVHAQDPNTNDNYGYDALGRVVSYDNGGQNTGQWVEFASGYDASGNRTKLDAATEFNGADFSNTSVYDHLNRMTEVAQSGPGVLPKSANFDYNQLSQVTNVRRHAGANPNAVDVATTQNLYGPAGELRDVSHNANGQSRGAYGYTRDAAGRITSMNVNGQVRNFTHDDNAQLVTEPGKTYAYDANGNRTTTAQHATGPDNRLKSDEFYDYEYDAEGNRVKRTHRLAGQVTTYVYDHRNRLIETAIGAATTANLGTVTPLVKLDGQGEAQPPVALFNGGQSLPAGKYAIEYVSGAIDYTGSTYVNDWTVNYDSSTYRYVIVSGTQPHVQAPGTSNKYATIGEVESASAGLKVTIDHAGGTLGVQLRDTEFSNNAGGATFRLVMLDVMPPAHERYAYDTSDRRVIKEIDVNNDGDFLDAADTKESFVYDGDEIALVFNKNNAIVNRYLHGPGVDEVLAEEGTHSFSLTSTTVILSGFGDASFDGSHVVTRLANGSWRSGDDKVVVYRIAGQSGWFVEVYDAPNEVYVYFQSTQEGPSPDAPPTSGWTLTDDGWGYYPNAAVDSIASAVATAWNTHWYLGDHQNSVRQVVGDDGAVQDKLDYDAFGNVLNQTNAINAPRFGYTGQEYDAGTGMSFTGGPGASYFADGLFIRQDPGYPAMASHPYAYTGNRPVDAVDNNGFSANFGGGGAVSYGGVREPSIPSGSSGSTSRIDLSGVIDARQWSSPYHNSALSREAQWDLYDYDQTVRAQDAQKEAARMARAQYWSGMYGPGGEMDQKFASIQRQLDDIGRGVRRLSFDVQAAPMQLARERRLEGELAYGRAWSAWYGAGEADPAWVRYPSHAINAVTGGVYYWAMDRIMQRYEGRPAYGPWADNERAVVDMAVMGASIPFAMIRMGGASYGRLYDVSTYNQLRYTSIPGTIIHHVPSRLRGGELIADYATDRMAGTGIGIRLPAWEADAVDAAALMRPGIPASARQEVAWQVRELRQHTGAPNSALKQVIRENREAHQWDFSIR